MKKILFLLVGAAFFFLQTASAQPYYSWENTNDNWEINPDPAINFTMSFSTVYGVTDGSYSLAMTGPVAPNGGVIFTSHVHTTNLTYMLGTSTSVWFNIYCPPGSFGGHLGISLEIWNPDTGYVSLDTPSFDGSAFPQIPAIGVQTNMCIPIPEGIRQQMAASPNATGLYFQMYGGYTFGNETFYMDNFCFNSLYTGTYPVARRPETSPGDTFYAQSVSGVTLAESAVGLPPRFLQWQTDGGSGGALTNIPDATNASYVFYTTNEGTYQFDCVVSNSYGAVTSDIVPVYVLPASAPLLTTDISPYSTNVYAFIGGNVSFSANFGSGTMPITNQWVFSSTGSGYTPIAGAANNSWTLTNVQSSGFYELAATNLIGRSNSTPAHLTALADPAAPPSNGVTNMYAYCIYTNHPWAYWKFEETNDTLTSSMQAYDYSGHNFDATYGNGDGTAGSGCKDGSESLPQYGPIPSGGYSGFPDNNGCASMSYNHNNGYLTVPPLNLNTNTVTFTMWVFPKSSVLHTRTGLFMNHNGGDAAGISFGAVVNGAGTPCLSYTWNGNSAGTWGWPSGLFPVANVWNFVACVITPSNTTIYLYYVAGSTTNLYKAVSSVPNAAEAFTGGTTWIGSDNWDNGRSLYGCMDEVAIFTNSLSETQVQGLFLKALGLNTGVPPVFYLQPTNKTVCQGQTLQLTAIAGGIPNPTYQWQVTNASGAWQNYGTSPTRMTTNETLSIQYYNGNYTTFRAIAKNTYGSDTSSVATVTMVPMPSWSNWVWIVNFAVATTGNGGPGTPYVGHGLLGTNTYWNALGGSQLKNTPISLRDDGVTPSGVNFGTTNGNVGTFSSLGNYSPMDNGLLDQFAQVLDTNGMNFFFTQVPKGKYNLALYGCVGAYLDRGAGFTVYTNGVSAGTQWITNMQDTLFMPLDNAVVFTNLLVTNGMLQVHEDIALATPLHTNSNEADFNGAQLALVTAGPDIWSITNSGANIVLTWAGGGLQQSTNLTPGAGEGWVTNTAVSPYTFAPTGAQKFFRIVNYHFP